jgi:molybdopterin synthase sulfur carrier subunit
MRITVRYFASVREQLGSSERLELDSAGVVTDMAWVRQQLMAHSAAHAAALAPARGLRMACNQTLCDAHQLVADGDEVAFFPPVTGG